jgi:hypothetical protein
MDQYKNADGTYTSPKNGKTYKSLKAFTSHLSYKGTTASTAISSRLNQTECKFCGKFFLSSNISKHENMCFLNPENIKLCKVCNSPIKNFKTSKGTCSRSCANKLFRTGENHGNWKQDRYQTTCFAHHDKKCVVCNEDKIVEVHHLDHNKSNNNPENLIPLCPTHHQYWHSRYRVIIEDIVFDYISEWKKNNSV